MRQLILATLPVLLAAQAPRETVTTRKDQQALAVTVYNNNLALVRDQREVRLAKGDSDLAFQEVAAQIRPETALLRNLSDPAGFRINEQNFDFDLLTAQKLLEKYVGRTVTVVSQKPNPDGPGSTEVREQAEVLACNGGVLLQFADRVEAASGRISFPGVPGNLRARPTLVLNLHSATDRAQKVELTYLTGGLSWQADYVASLAPDGKSLDLAGWVTLTNQSGAAYPNATLQLVAGDVNRVEGRDRSAAPLPRANVALAKGSELKEEGLFEYHLYTLDRPTTLKENQTKQVSLLTARAIPVRKTYLLRGESYYYQGRFGELGDKLKVAVQVAFDNRAGSGLGLPLPKGVVRVYQQDSAGRPQFIGEDGIDHTPRNDQVQLRVGNAFDLTAHRKQTDFKSLGPQGGYRNVYESAFRIDLKNSKPEPVTITVLEPLQGDWEIRDSNEPFTKENAGLAKFLVPVPAQGEASLIYRAQVRW